MTQLRICLLASVTALSALGQATPDAQQEQKRAAEAAHSMIMLSSTQPATALDHKKAAEAMHLVSSFSPGTSKTVKDKPFAADAVTETLQILADGNRIVRRNLTHQYRDRSGRTRREQTIETLGPSNPVTPKQMIFINDPVSNLDYVLDPESKLVRKFSRSEMLNVSTGSPAAAGDSKKENLGNRTIEGLACTGTRITVTIPAGQIGNERPLVSVTETWYSADIDAVVQSTTTDPRFGQTSYSLSNVERADQAPQLFEAPADYRTEEVSKPIKIVKHIEHE